MVTSMISFDSRIANQPDFIDPQPRPPSGWELERTGKARRLAVRTRLPRGALAAARRPRAAGAWPADRGPQGAP